MGSPGLKKARQKMIDAGVDEVAVDTFSHYHRLLEAGETGMIPEAAIEPVDMPALRDVDVPDGPGSAGVEALGKTVVIKLNGGLGTSMGMQRAKSLLCVRQGLSFLDIIARQVLALRQEHDVTLPLVLMNSFRTSADTMAALGRYDDLAVDGVPVEFLQNKEPKLLAKTLEPVAWPKAPDLEWCPPGHGDLYTALYSNASGGSGILDQLIEAGYRYAFVSNSDNLGAVADPRVAGWFARSGAPFAIEAVRRTASDRKGGHFARRRSDGRLILRETAQTLPTDQQALADIDRYRYCNTNNLWFDLLAMKHALDVRQGVLGLPLIRNLKHVDPADKKSPEVVQVETAMGAAIEVFEGAQLIEVDRDRFIPVKTTNDLLVLRSDVYQIGADFALDQQAVDVPYVDLDPKHYQLVADFDRRFPEGAPSLQKASSLKVAGDWTFGRGVQVEGDVELDATSSQRVAPGTVLRG